MSFSSCLSLFANSFCATQQPSRTHVGVELLRQVLNEIQLSVVGSCLQVLRKVIVLPASAMLAAFTWNALVLVLARQSGSWLKVNTTKNKLSMQNDLQIFRGIHIWSTDLCKHEIQATQRPPLWLHCIPAWYSIGRWWRREPAPWEVRVHVHDIDREVDPMKWCTLLTEPSFSMWSWSRLANISNLLAVGLDIQIPSMWCAGTCWDVLWCYHVVSKGLAW